MNSPLQMLVGGVIRVAQGFTDAAPTLLVGLLIAAILRYYLGREGTQKLFGSNRLLSLPQSWAIGMLLPVCSIGVIPILMEMRRARVKPGAMSAFALSAPLFNPLSLLYGLTLSRPIVIILFATGSLVIVTTLGLLWDAITRQRESDASVADDPNHDDETVTLIGPRRLFAIAVHMARESVGKTLLYSLVALSGLALLAAVLPYGELQSRVEVGDPFAPLTMMGVAVPAYATPMLAMSQLGMMFQHGNSPGAAFILLIMGTGFNFSLPLWFGRQFGFKASLIWTLTLILVVLAIGYGVNEPLVAPGVEAAGHTHAFDIYTNPLSMFHSEYFRTIGEEVTKKVEIPELFAMILLSVFAVAGIAFRALRIDDAKLRQNAPVEADIDSGKFDRIISRQVLGVTMIIGLIVMSIVACYAHYPSPSECLKEIRIARAECLSGANSGNVDHALFWIPVWEEWSRRLEVGTFIRKGEVRPYQRMQGYLIRKKLEALEHELEHDPLEMDEVKESVKDVMATTSRWVRAFRDDQESQNELDG